MTPDDWLGQRPVDHAAVEAHKADMRARTARLLADDCPHTSLHGTTDHMTWYCIACHTPFTLTPHPPTP